MTNNIAISNITDTEKETPAPKHEAVLINIKEQLLGIPQVHIHILNLYALSKMAAEELKGSGNFDVLSEGSDGTVNPTLDFTYAVMANFNLIKNYVPQHVQRQTYEKADAAAKILVSKDPFWKKAKQ